MSPFKDFGLIRFSWAYRCGSNKDLGHSVIRLAFLRYIHDTKPVSISCQGVFYTKTNLFETVFICFASMIVLPPVHVDPVCCTARALKNPLP